MAEWIDAVVGQRAGDEVEGQVEVGEGEEGEEEGDELIEEFDVEQDFAREGVVSLPDLLEVDQGVDGGEEGSIEPTTALGDEFRNCVCMGSVWLDLEEGRLLTRHISLAKGTFDELQHPLLSSFGYQLPTQDSVFSKVHVGCEDVGISTV